jgi:hypothetical protein
MPSLFIVLLALGQISLTCALKIALSNEKPINITRATLEGPGCTSSIRNTTIYTGDTTNTTNPLVAAIVALNGMTAIAFPKATNEKTYTDCTLAVDFTFPKGYQMSEAFLVTGSTVKWEPGMVRDTTLDVSFPTRPNYLVSHPFLLSSDDYLWIPATQLIICL